MSTDAYCVRAYKVLRDGVAGDAIRISEGRNIYPPSNAFLGHLGKLMQGLLTSDRFTYYESPADERDRELAAELLSQYLGYPGIEGRHVLFTNGSQEAISIVSSFCASQGLAAILPLPLYYSYEQSALRWGMSLNAYYRADGKVKWLGTPNENLFHVVQLPNPVTGTLFANPNLNNVPAKVRLTLLDCIYQLGAYGGPHELARHTRTAVREFPLDEMVLLFTASKDLSLPGLRSSVLVTGNDELLKYARADRFERVYSVNPFLGQIMSSYLALLLMNDSRNRCEAQYRNLNATFRSAGVPLASLTDLLSMCEHFDGMTDHCARNLPLLDHADSAVVPDLEPFAGYSVFPRLRCRFDNSDEFLQWANLAGRQHKLKLNPVYIFGGTPEIWNELYPDEARIRVNLSYPATALATALQRLEAAFGEVAAVNLRAGSYTSGS